MSVKEILNGLEKEYISNKPQLLTMYFEDGGEEKVVSFEDYNNLQQENAKLKKEQNNSINILKTITENLNNIVNIENITDGEYTYDYIMNFVKKIESGD